MKIIEIDQTITFQTQSNKTEIATVTGRNWWGESLESYIVRWKGLDVPVCAKTLKSQVAWC